MICIKTCMLSTVILFWLLSGMLMNKKTPEYNNLLKSLDDKQKNKLDKIVIERTNIFKISSLVSIVMTLLVLFKYRNKNTQSQLICLFIISYILLMSLIYMAWPKSDYMIRHLVSQEQRDLWVKMKQNIGIKKYFGIGIGLFVYSLFKIL